MKAVSDTSRFLPNWGAWMPISGTKSMENPYILVVKNHMKILLNHNIPHKISDAEMPEQLSYDTVTHLHWGFMLGV